MEELKPVCFSEHLSFNAYSDQGKNIETNFLLPPLQTAEGIDTAVAAIKHYQKQVGLPFAFELGANYLKPGKHEMPDGYFVNQIAEKADCCILLDMHNLWTNQQNGRQSIAEFIDQLDVYRISEIHVAAGFHHRNYYIDAHSGISSGEFMEMVETVVMKLPALKAIIFEIIPEYLNNLEDADLRHQLEQMHRIWAKRGSEHKQSPAATLVSVEEGEFSVREWEQTLGGLAIGHKVPETALSSLLSHDNGLSILKELIFHARASLLVSSLKLTIRLLRLNLGEDSFNRYLLGFFSKTSPSLFPISVAMKFIGYLSANHPEIRYLDCISQFELASIKTAADNKVRVIHFDFDPMVVIDALNNFELPPSDSRKIDFSLQIGPG